MRLEKFLGCMYGLAIGDALGFPVEFIDLQEIKKKYGNEGIKDFVKQDGFEAGTYSDDTQMSLAIANGLLESEDLKDLEKTMKAVIKKYVIWMNSLKNNRSPGNSCMRGVANLEKGKSWRESGDKYAKGCGAAMRSAPIGLVYDDLEKAVEVAHAASMCTHAHSTGIAAGIGTACLTYLALNGCKPEEMIDRVCEATEYADEKGEFRTKIRQIEEIMDLPEEEAIKRLGEGWIGEEAVAIALYCFLKSPNDYRKTVLRAVNISGDSDSVGCIAGAISGAYNGINEIPKEWVENVEDSELIGKIVENLYKITEN